MGQCPLSAGCSAPSSELVGVPADQLDLVWPDVLKLITAALKRGDGRFTPEDIRKALLERDMQLWLAVNGGIKGLCVTEIRNYPRKKVCAALICTGKDMREWSHHLDGIMDWARSEGCRTFEAWSRKGWARVFGDKLRMTHVMLERNL